VIFNPLARAAGTYSTIRRAHARVDYCLWCASAVRNYDLTQNSGCRCMLSVKSSNCHKEECSLILESSPRDIFWMYQMLCSEPYIMSICFYSLPLSPLSWHISWQWRLFLPPCFWHSNSHLLSRSYVCSVGVPMSSTRCWSGMFLAALVVQWYPAKWRKPEEVAVQTLAIRWRHIYW